MTVTIALASALAICLLPRRRLLAGVSGALWVVGGPFLAVVGGVSGLAIEFWYRGRGRAGARAMARRTEVVAVEAVAVGVSGGLSFDQAASVAAGAIGGDVGAAVNRSLRASTSGSKVPHRPGAITEMFAAAEMSRATGAPLADRLSSLAAGIRRDDAAAERQRLARLPVLLLFPLALLILPGFVLLAVAPAVVGGLSRLGL